MSDIQDLKHRRGTGDCYDQLANERKISDALERELNALKEERDLAIEASKEAVKEIRRLDKALNKARKALTTIADPNAVLPDDGRTTCRIYEDIANAALKSMEEG